MLALLYTITGLHIAITGSSQGIGLSAAKQLLSEGHTVYHACRSEERAEVARSESGGGIPMVCDLADLDSVRKFAADLKRSAPTLDVLCMNAAVAPSTKATTPKRTAQGFEEAIGTNHLGHFLLASLLVDHLSECGGAGRLVVTSSSVHDPDQPGGAVGGKGGATLGDLSGFGNTALNGPTMADGALEYDGSKVYKDSKLCNVLFCREAVKRWGDKVKIRSFSPGFIPSSGLFREPRNDNWLGATAFTFFAGLAGFAVPIDVGGDRLAYLATASDAQVPQGSYLSGPTGSKGFTREDGFTDGIFSKEGLDDAKAAKLWERSCEIVGV